MEIFADKFGSKRELHDWLITFYEEQLKLFLNDIGGITKHGVKITPRLIKTTIRRYSQLLEKNSVIDWEQS